MTDAQIRERLEQRSTLALTMWGEARGVAVECRIAVGCVVRNRMRWPARYRASGGGAKEVCLAPRQFSCWNGGDVNSAAVMAQAERVVMGLALTDTILQECFYLADGVLERVLLDNTRGATFYLERQLLERAPPIWTGRLKELIDIGPFVLFGEPPEKAIT